MKIIISDTTALIVLAKTNHFELLTNFIEKVYIPHAVMEELRFKDDEVKHMIENSTFIEVKKVENQNILNKIKMVNLDKGEIEAISLALETKLDLLIDEKAGRKYAKSKGVGVIGLLGVLKINLHNGFISYVELLYILDAFKKVNFRISPKLEKDFLDNLYAYIN